ncbi:hypothetical protein ACFLWS_02785 [Chloroflexota bacterium]
MKDLLVWWFSPKRAKRVSSIIKIIIGLLIVFSFFDALIRNTTDLIDAFVNPPMYPGTSYLLLPIISSFFTMAILWSVLFYLPYHIFGKRSEGRKRYLVPIILVALLVGSLFAGGLYYKPSTIEITRTQLALLEDRLGEMNNMGAFYTVREFSYDITKLTKPLPDYMINEAEGFSELVLFYKDSEKEWAELYNIPAGDKAAKMRGLPTEDEWRKNHIEAEAMLLFWGKYDKSVFRVGTKEAEEVKSLLRIWFDQYGIDKRMLPAFANWTLPPK